MPATFAVPDNMKQALQTFIETEGIPLAVVSDEDGNATVQVVASEKGEQSSATVLQAGGWIACASACKMAERLGIKLGNVGKLLNHLDIKVRACELGCFK